MKHFINIILIAGLFGFMYIVYQMSLLNENNQGWFILVGLLAILLGAKIHDENQNPQNRK